MSYRTFFLVGIGEVAYVDARVTYEDVEEGIKVERVSARMDGVELHGDRLEAAFPEAYAAAKAYCAMELRCRCNHGLHGPYRIHTNDPPTDEFLIQWCRMQRGKRAAITPQPKASPNEHKTSTKEKKAKSPRNEKLERRGASG